MELPTWSAPLTHTAGTNVAPAFSATTPSWLGQIAGPTPPPRHGGRPIELPPAPSPTLPRSRTADSGRPHANGPCCRPPRHRHVGRVQVLRGKFRCFR